MARACSPQLGVDAVPLSFSWRAYASHDKIRRDVKGWTGDGWTASNTEFTSFRVGYGSEDRRRRAVYTQMRNVLGLV